MFKSQQKLIAEIHNEFDTAQDRLLTQATEVLSSEIPAETTRIEEVATRLKSIGFTSTPTAKSGERLLNDKKSNASRIKQTREAAELITYYKFTYPFLKFITEDELNRICDKYSLIHAPVQNYIQDVPEKNLREIENAQVLKPEDTSPVKYRLVVSRYWNTVPKEIKSIIDAGVYFSSNHYFVDSDVLKAVREHGYKGSYGSYIFHNAELETADKSGLFIAAPSSHFNLTGLSNKSKHGYFNVFKTEIKDPIVFRYVRGGIQILSKWGLEASDPSLVVEKLN